MPARYRLTILLFIDALLLCAAGATAIVLRFLESGNLLLHLQIYLPDVLLGVIFYLASFYAFRLYHRVWAYASTGELLAIAGAATCGTAAHMAGAYLLYSDLPRSVLLLTWLFTIIYIGASRLAWRLYIEHSKTNGEPASRRVLIVGAGDAGVMVARELKNSSQLAIRPVGFVDDDMAKQRQVLLGLPVLGTRQDIPALVKRHGIDEIIIAMPSVPAAQIKEIATICTRSCPEVKILPGMYELIDGRVSISRLRRINVEDLLHREPVCLDLEQIAGYLGGKTVLVTGAGGSIGSELCRQVARFGPARLVLLGHGENSIHSIWLELQRTCPGLSLAVEIADVRDKERMDRIFARHRPGVVFHAAAHKHVPLMEMHPEEAVKTNLLGTRYTAQAADRHGCEIFVFISTDKAVNPSSVMGATKRLAEMYVQHMNSVSPTRFVSVRFGNVLGSRGSVVPVFQEQIKNGGPVTVTHPEMQRYFMTIPEAVSLVIQAGAMARGGEIFILDMGKPVKIVDLARDMIRLSGLEPDVDIKIEFTGIRPGEKLFEELLTAEEGAAATCHNRIYTARPCPLDSAALEREMARLAAAASQGLSGEEVFKALRRVLPGCTDYRDKHLARVK